MSEKISIPKEWSHIAATFGISKPMWDHLIKAFEAEQRRLEQSNGNQNSKS